MKAIYSLFLVIFLSSFLACSSDASSDNNNDDVYLKFTANGQNYDIDPQTINSMQKLIFGQNETSSVVTRLSLWMPVTPTVASHAITDDTPTDNNINTLYNAELDLGSETYIGISGTLVVTELTNEHIKGTFTFIGENASGATITISNGSFRAFR
jgi:hypothetical protein